LGIEAAARHYRHRAWRREARCIGAAAVLVAHTRDDALETALMRVLRGSGPAGLAAMPPVRGLIRRPLLRLGRADVLRYLEERHIPYRTDSTNQDNQYLRNRVRNQLIPLLDELFPHWKKGVAAMAVTQSLTAAFLAAEAERRVVWEWISGTANEVFPGRTALRTNAETFFAQPGIIREEALFRGIDLIKSIQKDSEGGNQRGGDIGDGPTEDTPIRRSSLRLFPGGEPRPMVSAANSAEGGAPQAIPPALDLGFCRISVKGSYIVIGPGKNQVQEAGFSLLIKEPGVYKLDQGLVSGFSLEAQALAGFSAGKEPVRGFYAALPFVLRPGFSGDFIICKDKKDKAARRVSLADARGKTEFRHGAAISAAVDCRGVAAFIGAGSDGMIRVLCREDESDVPFGNNGDAGGPSFFVAVSHGGIDA
jgi:tRNA(Ile)-lysidine synthase